MWCTYTRGTADECTPTDSFLSRSPSPQTLRYPAPASRMMGKSAFSRLRHDGIPICESKKDSSLLTARRRKPAAHLERHGGIEKKRREWKVDERRERDSKKEDAGGLRFRRHMWRTLAESEIPIQRREEKKERARTRKQQSSLRRRRGGDRLENEKQRKRSSSSLLFSSLPCCVCSFSSFSSPAHVLSP